MNYYIVKIPCSGAWLREPYQGASLDRNQAWPYPEDHRHLHAVVYQMRTQGLGKLRLRQVMAAEDA